MKRAVSGPGNIPGPWESTDYGKLLYEAKRELDGVKSCLERRKNEVTLSRERELIRRRELKILTMMYYEQKGRVTLFESRLKENSM